MKIIDLLNKIANGEIEDKRTFNIIFKNGLQRSIYYDKDEENCMNCLKNVSDDYSIYDDVSFDTEIATVDNFKEEPKKIPEKLKDILRVDDLIPPVDENMYKIWTQTIKNQNKINEILDYLKSKGE